MGCEGAEDDRVRKYAGRFNVYFPACGTMMPLAVCVIYFGVIPCMSKQSFAQEDLILIKKSHYF